MNSWILPVAMIKVNYGLWLVNATNIYSIILGVNLNIIEYGYAAEGFTAYITAKDKQII